MKKKIKDLTLGECERICLKTDFCSHCPILVACPFMLLDSNKKRPYLEREVEVDE